MFISVIRICEQTDNGQELNAQYWGQEHESRGKVGTRNSMKITSVVSGRVVCHMGTNASEKHTTSISRVEQYYY